MAHIWQGLRSGDWLTAARMRNYSLILLVFYVLATIGWIAASDGLIDPNGKPIGTDFSSFYAAGTLVLDGKAGDVYNMAAHYAREQQLFGPETPHYAWLYPPIFLFLATPLALLSYPAALATWLAITFALYLAVVGAILRRAWRNGGTFARLGLLAATAFPAVFINLGHGQNGFLTAGLLGAALLALPERPVLAGLLFGLLAYKPQFALLVPFALLAAGQWRTILAAALTVLALAGASWLIFGSQSWWSFAASTETSRQVLLEQGSVGFEKLQSIFAAIRMWDGSIPLSYAAQGAVSALSVCSVAWVWHSCEDRELKSALLIAATLLASPHVLDYDLTILAPAIAFFVAARTDGRFRDYEISLLAAVWIAPLLARSGAGTIGVPLGLLAICTLCALIMRRTLEDRGASTVAGIAQA